MSKAKLFWGGLTTDPEIALLAEHIGVPEEGDEISYKQIEELADCEWNTSRFRTITNRWRRMLRREHGLVTTAVAGECFRVEDSNGRLRFGKQKRRESISKLRNGFEALSGVDARKLNEEERRHLDHETRLQHAVLTAARNEDKRSVPKFPSLSSIRALTSGLLVRRDEDETSNLAH